MWRRDKANPHGMKAENKSVAIQGHCNSKSKINVQVKSNRVHVKSKQVYRKSAMWTVDWVQSPDHLIKTGQTTANWRPLQGLEEHRDVLHHPMNNAVTKRPTELEVLLSLAYYWGTSKKIQPYGQQTATEIHKMFGLEWNCYYINLLHYRFKHLKTPDTT